MPQGHTPYMTRVLHPALVVATFLASAIWLIIAIPHNATAASIGAASLLLWWTVPLAIEFGILAGLAQKTSNIPRASSHELLKAFAGECWAVLLAFGWHQAFRASALPDRTEQKLTPPRSKPCVVMVHGLFCSRAVWNPWMKSLRQKNYNYLAPDLVPISASIDQYIPVLHRSIEQAVRLSGRPAVVLAHSMGGLVVRAWLADNPAHAALVSHVLTIATPHAGTWLARWGATSNARQMRLQSAWLERLNQAESLRTGTSFTCFYSNCDNIVIPSSSALLQSAENRFVAASGHLSLLYEPAVRLYVADLLDKVSSQQAIDNCPRHPAAG